MRDHKPWRAARRLWRLLGIADDTAVERLSRLEESVSSLRADTIVERLSSLEESVSSLRADTIVERLSSLEESVSSLRADAIVERLSSLEEFVSSLRRTLLRDRRVDLVRIGKTPVFMYCDDLAYEQASDCQKLMVSHQFDPIGFLDRVEPLNQSFIEGTALATCLDHLMKHFDDVAFLDIGCQYGTSAIDLGVFVASRGRKDRIYAFDPGETATLVPANLEMNKSSVEFFPLAVSSRCGLTLFFSDVGNTENSRLGNCVGEFTRSYPVRTTTLDAFLREHGGLRSAYIKIDTQGFDPEVVEGARELISKHPVIILMEFSPHAIFSRRSPSDFLRSMLVDLHIFDQRDLYSIQDGDCEAFTRSVDNSPAKWTDLLCISRKLPEADKLCDRFRHMAPKSSALVAAEHS